MKKNLLIIIILMIFTANIELKAETWTSNIYIQYRGICDCGEFWGRMACGNKPTCAQVCFDNWTRYIWKEYSEDDIDFNSSYGVGDCDNARLLPVDDSSKCSDTDNYVKSEDGKCYTKCSLQIFKKSVCDTRLNHKWNDEMGCCIYTNLTQQTGCTYQTTEEACMDYDSAGCIWKDGKCIVKPSEPDPEPSNPSGGGKYRY